MILVNRDKAGATVAVSWQELGLPFDSPRPVRDLTSAVPVAPHDVVMIRVG